MSRQTTTNLIAYGLLAVVSAASFLLPSTVGPQSAQAVPASPPPPATVQVNGVVRDFREAHPDFGITNLADMGHYVHNVADTLGADGKPMYVGGGVLVSTEWKDKNANPIMPYDTDDDGLPGGHFDIDVFKDNTTNQVYHKHQYDDVYKTNLIDIVQNSTFLFTKYIPKTYANPIRVQFFNVANGGGGTYSIVDNGVTTNGVISAGLTKVISPSKITKFELKFNTLSLMRQTTPSLVHNDTTTRDSAFRVRFYDNVTNVFKYEVDAYTHVSSKLVTPTPPPPPPTLDVCGNVMADTNGDYTTGGFGAVQDANSFYSWFHDTLGQNVSANYPITLTRDASGVYKYNTNTFFPADNTMLGNEGAAHNYYFTYQFSTTFVYHKCATPAQYFEFEGNDDAWVFINNKMVIDLGGVRPNTRQRVDIDRLGLVDGNTYPLDFFYASRRVTGLSVFNMKTTLVLGSNSTQSVSAGFD